MSFRSCVLVLLTLMSLTACADMEMSASGPCEVTRMAEFPLERRSHLILAPAKINDSVVAMVVDTGAEMTAVTGDMITRLGLLADPRNGTLMSGVGGEGLPQNDALVDHLAFGPYDSGSTHYAVIDFGLGKPNNPPLGGLLGAEVLSRYDLDLDVAHSKLALYKVRHCSGDFIPWKTPHASVKLDVTWSNMLMLPVQVDGTTLNALLDSGSSGTVLDSAAAERVGLTSAVLGKDKSGKGVGAAGVNFRESAHTFSEIRVGSDRWKDPVLGVLDRTMRQADMLLGLDYLSARHVWISYRTRQLFVEKEQH